MLGSTAATAGGTPGGGRVLRLPAFQAIACSCIALGNTPRQPAEPGNLEPLAQGGFLIRAAWCNTADPLASEDLPLEPSLFGQGPALPLVSCRTW